MKRFYWLGIRRLCDTLGMRYLILILALLASDKALATSPGAIGTAVLNSCGTNVTDPICRDLSLGRQYIDLTYRRYLMQFMREPYAIAAVGVTNAVIQKRLTLVLTRKKGLGAPEITVRRNEGVITFHWSF